MKKVSVVIVSHNNKDILPKCLNALKQQSYKNFEVYLMDNDSSDGTPEFIKKNYPLIKFFNISESVSKKRNMAIKKSNSEYIITLDSDNVLSKEWIKTAVKYMDEHKNVGICCGKMIGRDKKIDWAGGIMDLSGGIADRGHGQKDSEEYDSFKQIPVMTTANAIIRRKTLEEIGIFDEVFYYDFEDADLGLRANLANWRVIYNPELISIHSYHSTISKMDKKQLDKIRFYSIRNKNLMLLKNFEMKTLFRNSPWIVLSNLNNFIKNPLISLKAFYWIFSNIGTIYSSRKITLKKKKIKDKDFFQLYEIPPLVRYSNKKNKLIWFFKRINQRKIKNLTFFITSRCNSRCKHCFYWKSLNQNKDLSLEQIEKIFSKFFDVYAISLGGGEPFLRTDIDKIIKIAKKYTDCKIIDIPTNGLIDIFPKLEQILKENPHIRFAIHPSLDGFKEDHDYIRGVNGGFEKTISLIKRLAKLKKIYPNFVELAVNTVVMNKNFKNLERFIEFVKTLPVSGHAFEIIRGDHQQILGPPNPSQLRKIAKIAYQTQRYYNKKFSLIKRIFYNLRYKEVWRTQLNAMKGRKWRFKCTAGLTDFVIDSNGDAKICELQPLVGNMLTDNYPEVLNTNPGRSIFKKMKNHECDCTHNCNISSSMDCSFKNIFFDRWFYNLV